VAIGAAFRFSRTQGKKVERKKTTGTGKLEKKLRIEMILDDTASISKNLVFCVAKF
jgi:hypothetical protein